MKAALFFVRAEDFFANGQGLWCYFLCVDKESNQRKPPPLFPSLENESGSAHPWARSLWSFISVHWEMKRGFL